MLPSENAEIKATETNTEATHSHDTAVPGDTPSAATAAADPKAKNRLPEIPIAERASISCQNDLDQVLAAHKRWVDAVLDPNVEVASGRANLQGLDLRAYQLAGANLSGANLAQCILTSCDLSRVNLTVANLQGAQLQDANLQGAKLTRAKLEGADLRGADLTGANLNGVDLSKCILKSEQLKSSHQNPERAGATTKPTPADTSATPSEATHDTVDGQAEAPEAIAGPETEQISEC